MTTGTDTSTPEDHPGTNDKVPDVVKQVMDNLLSWETIAPAATFTDINAAVWAGWNPIMRGFYTSIASDFCLQVVTIFEQDGWWASTLVELKGEDEPDLAPGTLTVACGDPSALADADEHNDAFDDIPDWWFDARISHTVRFEDHWDNLDDSERLYAIGWTALNTGFLIGMGPVGLYDTVVATLNRRQQRTPLAAKMTESVLDMLLSDPGTELPPRDREDLRGLRVLHALSHWPWRDCESVAADCRVRDVS